MIENPLLAYNPEKSTRSYGQGHRFDFYMSLSGWFQDPSRPLHQRQLHCKYMRVIFSRVDGSLKIHHHSGKHQKVMNLCKKNNPPPNSFCQEKVGNWPLLSGFDCWLMHFVNDIVLNSIKSACPPVFGSWRKTNYFNTSQHFSNLLPRTAARRVLLRPRGWLFGLNE